MSDQMAILRMLMHPPVLWVVLAFVGIGVSLPAAALLAPNKPKQERYVEAALMAGTMAFLVAFGAFVVIAGGNFN